MADSDRRDNVFASGTILNRIFDRVRMAVVAADLRGDEATEQLATVSNLADTVIAARPGRVAVSVQVQGVASGVRVVLADSTAGGTLGELLDPATGPGLAGGYWSETRWAGAIALRATAAPVVVSIREVYCP